MNKFLLSFVLLTLFTQYAVTETKPQANPTRTKKEDVAATDLSSSVVYGSTSSEGYNSHLDDNTITPTPENILNTPTTLSPYQNPIFNGQNGAYNQYGYSSKSQLSNYKLGTVDDGSYKPQIYNNYGKPLNNGYQYSQNPYYLNQGQYSSGNNYAGYQSTPGYYDDGRYKNSAYNYSSYTNKSPSSVSGIHYPYQQSFSAYQPLNSGYYSGNQDYYYHGGLNYKESSSKLGSGSSSGTSSGTSGNAATGFSNSGAYKSGYNSGVPTYATSFNSQYKPYSIGSYGYSKYNYPGYQYGQLKNYYDQGYYEFGKGEPVTSGPLSSFSSTSASKASSGPVSVNSGPRTSFGTAVNPNLSEKIKPNAYPYNYEGYLNRQTNIPYVEKYSPSQFQTKDYSKFFNTIDKDVTGYNIYNSGTVPTTTLSPVTSKTSQTSSTFSPGISGSLVSTTGTGSLGYPGSSVGTGSVGYTGSSGSLGYSGLSGKFKTGTYGNSKTSSSVGSSTYPGYSGYQTGSYDFNVYRQHPTYDYSQYNTGFPGYQVRPPTFPSYLSSVSSSSSKSSTTPYSKITNTVSSTTEPSTTSSYSAGQSDYKLSHSGYYNPYSQYPGFQSGYLDGTYQKNIYDINKYSSSQFNQNPGRFDQGVKYQSNVFAGKVSPATSSIPSGISSSAVLSSSNFDFKPGNQLNQGNIGTSYRFGNVGSSYPYSYDFSGYGKKSPSEIPTPAVNPSYYNYASYQPNLINNYNDRSKYNPSGYYQYPGNSNYPYQSGNYYESGYRSGSNVPYNVTSLNSGSSYNLGSFTSDGKYNPSFSNYGSEYYGQPIQQFGTYPGYYGAGHYDNAGAYHHDGGYSSYSNYAAPYATNYPVASSTTSAPVTSSESTTVK